MEEVSNKLHPCLPANYVTLADLRERWMEKQKQIKRDEDNKEKELQRTPENLLIQSKPNPKSSNLNRRPIETSRRRWVQVSQSKPPGLVSSNVKSDVEPCGEICSSGKDDEKKKPRKWNKKRNDEKKDVVQSQPEKCVKDNPEQGFEVGIEAKLAGLSMSTQTGRKIGGKSMIVRNQRPLRTEKERGYGRFEGRVRVYNERARSDDGLVWVKKGEAS